MTSEGDLIYTPAHELARQIAARTLSARELVDVVIARAAQVQPKLNCFAAELYDEAQAAADEADAAVARGDALGPLHGVPLTIKDGIATMGHILTFGATSRAGEIATTDDIVWQRLRAAGAILVGKTTTPEYFHKVVTDSPFFGVTRNPWSLNHTPGGSSGGAAAALAAGIGPVAIGSDGGGSIRCPPACTATLGMKPTMGRIPRQAPDTFANYATVGPMARNVRDLATTLSIISGPARDDAASLRVPPLKLDLKSIWHTRRLSIGWIANPGHYGVDSEVEALTFAAVEALTGREITVHAIEAAFLDRAFDAYRVIASVGHAAWARGQPPAEHALTSDSYRSLVRRGLSYSAAEFEAAQEARTWIFREVQATFDVVDVIATPTLTAPPMTVDTEGSVESGAFAAWAAALYPFNLTGHPAISVPCGFTAGGLPVGIQFVGPWYEEERILHLASVLETARPWSGRRPPL